MHMGPQVYISVLYLVCEVYTDAVLVCNGIHTKMNVLEVLSGGIFHHASDGEGHIG